jgi:hypothetical protein
MTAPPDEWMCDGPAAGCTCTDCVGTYEEARDDHLEAMQEVRDGR